MRIDTLLEIMTSGILLLCSIAHIWLIVFLCTHSEYFISSSRRKAEESKPAAPEPPAGQDEAELQAARLKYQQSQKAFEQMMNYNAYQAYGMTPTELDEE